MSSETWVNFYDTEKNSKNYDILKLQKRNKNNLYFFKNNEYIYELNKHFIAAVHCSGSSAHLRSQVLTDGRDVKRINQDTIHYSKVVTFLATRNTDNSIKHRK